jgi:SAM-dependent methyltransferase
MKTADELKELVREKYGEIALQSRDENAASCCGVGGCATVDYEIFSEDYSKLQGYNPEADLGLGCGVPTEFALIKEGDTVVDLGSGAGNDAFVARAIAGERGRVIGIDMTEAMIEKARANSDKLGFNNVEFRFGDIEKMPIGAGVADVVISNCVLNLVPDKEKAFGEMYRILKTGGHFSVSDVVLSGALPENLRTAAEMYAGCVSGAIEKSEYVKIAEAAGFKNVKVQKEKVIAIPDDILQNYLSADELAAYKTSGNRILSITLYGEKAEKEACCAPGCCD